MRHRLSLAVGPVRFRIGSAWRGPIRTLTALYAGYPLATGVPDFTVRLEPTRAWRRRLRPSVAIGGDYRLPEAAPLPLAQGLLAAEMAMNLQMALGWRRHLLLHAGVVEQRGQALVLTGASGSGKSTLAALLGERGWRFMGDEFALLDPATGDLAPFPRPVSLKNESIALVEAPRSHQGPGGGQRWGPLLAGTPKGDIRHLVPAAAALARMDEPARPALIVFPSFGFAEAMRAVPPGEAFARLTQASTNYTALGEAGFGALTRLVREVPAVAIDYPDTATALRLIDTLWSGR